MMHWNKIKLLILAGLSSMPAFGIEDLGEYLHYVVGPVDLRPHLAVAEKFDDNIYYDGPLAGTSTGGTSKRSDFISMISPGIIFSVGSQDRNYFLLDYTSVNSLYWDHSELDAFDHLFLFQTRVNPGRFRIIGKSSFQMLFGVLGSDVSSSTNLSQIAVHRNAADNSYRVGYEISSKTSIYAEASHQGYDFEANSPYIDYDTIRATLGYEITALPRTSFFGEGYYGWNFPTANIPGNFGGPDSTFIGGFLGARGYFATKLSYLLKVGYEVRSFSGNNYSDLDSLVTEAALNYSFAEKSIFTVGYSRRNNVSIQDPGVIYLSDTVNARLSHFFGPDRKFEAGIGISYVINSYEGTIYNQRVDDAMRINFDITYKMKTWLSAKVGYEFEHLESSFTGVRNYDANRVVVQMVAGFL